MILNETNPNFPPWPFIKAIDGKKEYVVFGDHISFARYGWTVWFMDLTTYFLFFYTWYLIFTAKRYMDMWKFFGLYFLVYLPIITIIPIPRWLSLHVYPCKDRVRFTPQGIIIRGNTYQILSHVSIQFRANRSPMSERKYARLRSKDQADGLRHKVAYKLEFRQVEMIYGARIVPITTLAPAELAEQYAIALQLTYDLITRDNTSSAHSFHEDREREDAYPE